MPDSLASLTHSRANLLMELAEVDNQIADIARDARRDRCQALDALDALKAENALLRAKLVATVDRQT